MTINTESASLQPDSSEMSIRIEAGKTIDFTPGRQDTTGERSGGQINGLSAGEVLTTAQSFKIAGSMFSDTSAGAVPGVQIDHAARRRDMPELTSAYKETVSSFDRTHLNMERFSVSDQAEAGNVEVAALELNSPFPRLKMEGGSLKLSEATVRTEAAERIQAIPDGVVPISNSNRQLLETSHQFLNKKPWQESKFKDYLKDGELANAASVSEVLKATGFKFQDSANPINLVKRLLAEGWTMHGIKDAKAGDVVFGGKENTKWQKGSNNSNIGILSAHGDSIYHNGSEGNWTTSQLKDVFKPGEYGGQVWILRPPEEIAKTSIAKPVPEQETEEVRRTVKPEQTRSIDTTTSDRIPERRVENNGPRNPEGEYWSDYWKNHFDNFWREHWKEHYSKRETGRQTRADNLPTDTTWRPDSRRQDFVDRRDSGRNLPPGWENEAWREREGERNPRRNDGHTPGRDVQVVAHRPGNLNVMGPPTITPQKIDQVLAEYDSPAQGLGQKVFDLGVKHGINPAIALAFFIKESSAGTKGVARTTLNWGNRKGEGPAGRYRGFMKYDSFSDSLEDWFPYIIDKYVNQGRTTLPRVIAKYAPGYDGNDERGYVRAVDNLLTKWSRSLS